MSTWIFAISRWWERLWDRPQLCGQGIDVSRWQGSIRWHEVPQSWAYLKATEGVGYVDPRYASNVEHARAAGKTIGAYHFARIDSGDDPVMDARAEVLEFWTACGARMIWDLGLRPCLDVELGGMQGKDPAYIRTWWRAAIEAMIECSGQPPVIYTGRWSLRKVFGRETLPDWLTRCPLWWAEYTNGDAPKHVPQEWTHFLAAWQFTAKGKVPGIRGRVDLNRPGPALSELLFRQG